MENEEDVDTMWDEFKTAYNETAEVILGKRRKDVKEWVSENTLKTIEKRKEMKRKMNSIKSTRSGSKWRDEYQKLDREVKRKCRRDKREYINGMIREGVEAARKGEQGTLYRITRKNSVKFKCGSSVLRDKDGNIFTKEKDKQKRWNEHFEEVLNREPPK